LLILSSQLMCKVADLQYSFLMLRVRRASAVSVLV
jgi:hypothetical protein